MTRVSVTSVFRKVRFLSRLLVGITFVFNVYFSLFIEKVRS
jgi:hypothetical protein